MPEAKTGRSGYLENALREVSQIIYQAEDKKDANQMPGLLRNDVGC